MNQAVKYATGKYLFFLNCGDVLYDQNVLSNIYVSAIKFSDNHNVIYGNYIRKNILYKQPGKLSNFFFFRTPLCHQTMFIGKTVFDKYGLYDESLKICADYEYTVKTYRAGVNYIYNNYTICIYKGDGVSETREKIINKDNYEQIKLRHFTSGEIRKYNIFLKLSMIQFRQKLISDNSPQFIRWLYRRTVNILNR
jgi:hypothetical protein